MKNKIETPLDQDIHDMISMGYGVNYGKFIADKRDGFRRKKEEDAYRAAVLRDAQNIGK